MNRRPFKFERIIDIFPVSHRNEEGLNKGVITTVMVLKTKKNAVTFSFKNGIFWENKLNWIGGLSSVYVCYHSQKPIHTWDAEHDGNCPYTGNGKCYTEGSFSDAEEFLNVLIETGTDAVWEMLEQYYIKIFGEKKAIYEHI